MCQARFAMVRAEEVLWTFITDPCTMLQLHVTGSFEAEYPPMGGGGQNGHVIALGNSHERPGAWMGTNQEKRCLD